MNVIIILKGDLGKPDTVEIGVVESGGRLRPKGGEEITLVTRSVTYPNQDITEKQKQTKKVFVTIDYSADGFLLHTIRVYDHKAKEMAETHIKNRQARYDNEGVLGAAVVLWNELTPKAKVKVTVEDISVKLLENASNPIDFLKANKREVIATKRSVILPVDIGDVSIF